MSQHYRAFENVSKDKVSRDKVSKDKVSRDKVSRDKVSRDRKDLRTKIRYNYEDVILHITKGINLTEYSFKDKPLVVGGLALEYYGIRQCGNDFDYMVSPRDWQILKQKHSENINLFGGETEEDVDATINLNNNGEKIDLIYTLYQFNYDYLKEDSIEHSCYRIISLEKLLLLKTLAAVDNNDSKSAADQKLIVDFIVSKQYPNLNSIYF